MSATNFLKALSTYAYPTKVKTFFEELFSTYSITDSADNSAMAILDDLNKSLPYNNKGTSYTSQEHQTIQTKWTNIASAFNNDTTVEFFPYDNSVKFTNGSTVGTFTYTEIIDSAYSTTPTTITITCKFNAQGGMPVPYTQTATTTSGTLIVTEPTTPAKAHYTFLGWFTAASGGTQVAFPYTISQSSDYTLTLYAQWELISPGKGGYIII